MVGLHSGGSSAALGAQVADQRLGSVILLGNWGSGVSGVRSATSTLRRSASAAGLPGLLVAADQEGGQVQRLQGPGFSRIPSAREQGTLGPAVLRQRAAGWSRQLARAGVDVNLAPVADTVPRSLGDANEPIGALDRDFVPGSPGGNGTHAAAFVRGSLDGGVVPAVKHFPGIGRLRSNTDFSATGITDPVTSATDPYLAPFRAAVAAGSPVVMMSSARYPRLDPDRQALFSPRVVTGLLRGDLGFDGVVVTDDVGAADSVAAVPVGERATRFVAAGGDIVLTAEPSQAATMLDALVDRARTDPAFASRLRASATRVVSLKARAGLVRCG
jgi:beta-N-acetylhexosaminidase